MFGGAYFGQSYQGQGYPVSSPIFDNATNSGAQSLVASYSWTHKAGLSNRGIIVTVSLLGMGGSVSNVTYNGVNMTLVRADTNGSYRGEIWKMENPAYGSKTVTVTLSGSLTSTGSAISYGNVNQSNMIDNNTSSTGTGGLPSNNILPASNRDWVMALLTTSNTTATAASTQTNRAGYNGAAGSGVVSDRGPISPASTTTMSYSSVGGSDAWIVQSISIRPSVSVSNYLLGLVGSLSFSGSLFKRDSKNVAGSLSFVGNAFKRASRALTGALSFAGTVTPKKMFGRLFTASLSFSGAFSRAISKKMTGNLSFVGAISRFTKTNRTASLSFVGSIKKNLSKRLTASLSFVGFLTRTLRRNLSGSLSFVGNLKKRFARNLTASLSFTGVFGRTFDIFLSASLSFVGVFIGTVNRYIVSPIVAVINSTITNRDVSENNPNSSVSSENDQRNIAGATDKSDVASGSSGGILDSDNPNRTLE